MDGTSGLTNIGSSRCEKLRWKGMYIEAEWDPTIQHSNGCAFWCQHTFNCLGPDGKQSTSSSAGRGRKCYEEL